MTQKPPKYDAATLLKLATYASTATAVLLIVVKLVAWILTGSLSVLASLVDSLMDAAASLINLLAVRYSLKSADSDHQFGHGKAEALAGLGQSSFIAGSALFLIFQASERLTHPFVLKQVDIGIWIMVFAILATLVLLTIQRYVIRRTNSMAIRADALHYQTDLLTNSGSIAALIVAKMGFEIFDPLCSLAIAVYILKSARHIGRESMQMLMDRELSQEIRDNICDMALTHPQVLGIHDLRTRQSGQTMVIQLHLDLDENLSLAEAHAITKEVEKRILSTYPGSDVIIHEDPVSAETYHFKRIECD